MMSKLQENIAKARDYLARFKKNGVLNRIDGKDVAAADGSTYETISPVDLKPLATVARGKAEDIDRAARAAKAAFAEWAAMPGEARKYAAVLGANYPGSEWYQRAFQLMREKAPEVAGG